MLKLAHILTNNPDTAALKDSISAETEEVTMSGRYRLAARERGLSDFNLNPEGVNRGARWGITPTDQVVEAPCPLVLIFHTPACSS